jgi:hypothetical protein
MDALAAAALEIYRSPEFKGVVGVFVFLGSINAGFWILARVMSSFVDLFSELFLEELWSVVAILYNIALAVLFSAILFVSAVKGAAPKDLLWRQGCGFVMLYIALGAAYMDKTHHIHDDARPGYALGLVSYIVFAAFPRLVAYPELSAMVGLIKTVSDSWLGKALTVFMVGGIVWGIVHKGLREMFYHLSPFLWFMGALKHPPIRVRRNN